jgi:hypothetical protein
LINNNETFFLVLSFDLLLIALLKAFYWKFTKQLLLSVYAQRYANQYLKEDNVFTERVTFLVTIIMLLNISLFIAKALFGTNLIFLNFFKIFVAIAMFFMIKVIIIRLLGHVLLLKGLTKLGVYFSLLFDRVMGIILFPLVVVLFFSPIASNSFLLLFSAIIIGVFLAIKIFWLWKIGIDGFGLSRYYLFMYVCTLEILPLVVLTKVAFY